MADINELRVTYCAPFWGRLGLNGTINAWLLPRLLHSGLMGREITEQDLYDYIVENDPKYHERFRVAGIEDLIRYP